MRTLNEKWSVLAEKLRAAGWDEKEAQPCKLAREYFAGRAHMSETQEEEGNRTIYSYATSSREWHDPAFGTS